MYHNFHKHSHESNIRTIDCVVKPTDYFKRMLELGHTKYFTTEHGYQGNILETLRQAEIFNKDLPPEKQIQVVVGVEAYFTEDHKEKDRKAYHVNLIALNDRGVEQINGIMSYANIEGFYYKPRIDFKAIQNYINPKDVICTSACVAGIGALWNDRSELIIKWFKDYFKDNLFLEVQAHANLKQAEHNKKMLEYANKYGIEIIHANDSHYIYPEDAIYRDILLESKKMLYPEEEGFILDYPNEEVIYRRYQEQGVLSPEQVKTALYNTLVFDKCESLTMYSKDIKIPPVSENPKEEFKHLLNQQWIKLKNHYPKERYHEYFQAIREEQKIIENTNMEEYFLMDYKICKVGREKYGAVISKTGRGSAGSFFLNTLLEILNMDRLDSPVTLYPTRFMSTTRILESKSLADIDINVSNQESLIKASEDILGKRKTGWMITFKPLQEASAFKLLARVKGFNFDECNEVSKDLDLYRSHPKWKDIIEESKQFIGVIDSIAPSPCSMLLSPYDVASHIGYMKVGDKVCCNLDGYNCDYWKYLKNDILAVTVWEIIEKVCSLANIEIPTIKELENLLDDKVYDIYANRLTCTINQADSDYATNLVHRYKPKSVAEVCAFVAALRPGFASLLDNFINRRPYTTGVKELDNILDDSFHYLMYQESIMKYLVWLGIPEDETYGIIKKISKKKFKEDELRELKIKLHNGWKKVVGREEGFEETWRVVEDASRYSFNASHSLAYAYDSLYCAYLKSHYPLEYYSVVLNLYQGDTERTSRLVNELGYFGIKLESAKFRKSKAEYFMDKEANTIYKGIESIKFINNAIGKFLWSIKDEDITFSDLISRSKGIINSRQMNILIDLGFFEEFGNPSYLSKYYEVYNKYIDSKTIKKDKCPIPLDVMREFSKKETEKQFSIGNNVGLINYIMEHECIEESSVLDTIRTELEFTGNIVPRHEQPKSRYIISDIETRKYLFLTVVNLSNGKEYKLKVDKGVIGKPEKFDIFDLKSANKKPKNVMINGKWNKSTTEFEYWITKVGYIYKHYSRRNFKND